MTVDEIVKYVFSSPENSNPNILRSMLSQIEGGGDTPIPSGEETMIININGDQFDKTWQEIDDALNAGTIVYCVYDSRSIGRMYVIETFANETEGQYIVAVINRNEFDYYLTDSTSGYPALYVPDQPDPTPIT